MQSNGFVPPRPPKELQKKADSDAFESAKVEKKVEEIAKENPEGATFSNEKISEERPLVSSVEKENEPKSAESERKMPPKMPTPPPRRFQNAPVTTKNESEEALQGNDTVSISQANLEDVESQRIQEQDGEENEKSSQISEKIEKKEPNFEKIAIGEEKKSEGDIQKEEKQESYVSDFEKVRAPKEEKLKTRSNVWNWVGAAVFTAGFAICLFMLFT